MRSETLENMALALPGTRESSHFGKRDFRVGKHIFMSFPEPGRAVVKLTPDQQALLLATEPGLAVAVSGGWGARGWTSLYFTEADGAVVRDVIERAWRNVAPRRLERAFQSMPLPPA
ncbi:MmcQ/YjbR family DNA-binding protein [Ensifer soli]|uniref:MmcQ/YjbR family DNA-binding protein n=1 Tax=Ciceribacter sp. sgz301302 TaxID=3342379 RepID=UPI0035B6C911